MENVQDILKKDDAAYMKYAMGRMITQDYQVRSGHDRNRDQGGRITRRT